MKHLDSVLFLAEMLCGGAADEGCILNHEYFEVTKLGLLIEINNCNNFQESFEQFRGLGLNSRPFSV